MPFGHIAHQNNSFLNSISLYNFDYESKLSLNIVNSQKSPYIPSLLASLGFLIRTAPQQRSGADQKPLASEDACIPNILKYIIPIY